MRVWPGLRDYVEVRWNAHNDEHAALRESIRRAAGSIDHRLEVMNAFREENHALTAQFFTKDAADRMEGTLGERIDRVEKAQSVWRGGVLVIAFGLTLVAGLAGVWATLHGSGH